jgi:hypothetical protein
MDLVSRCPGDNADVAASMLEILHQLIYSRAARGILDLEPVNKLIIRLLGIDV